MFGNVAEVFRQACCGGFWCCVSGAGMALPQEYSASAFGRKISGRCVGGFLGHTMTVLGGLSCTPEGYLLDGDR